MTTTAATLPLPDLLDPATFSAGPADALQLELAERQLVRAWSEREQLQFWVVGSHREVSELVRDWRRLSSQAKGTILHTGRSPRRIPDLTSLDPPRHTVLRRGVAGLFKAATLERLESVTRDAAMKALAALARPEGGDLVAAARLVPAEVTGELFGIPPEERDRASRLGHLVNFVEDPGYRDVLAEARPAEELAAVAHDLAARQRRSPSPGLMADLLATGTETGEPVTVEELEAMVLLLIAAGNGTTIDALVSAVRLLAEHPAELAALASAPPAAYRSAVEEVLRLATPVNYFARTATEPIELLGETIAPGEQVALYFAAANRDARVFADPLAFRPARSPNPHVSFGVGVHSCLGAALARLELRVVLEELCRHYRIEHVEPEPRRIVSHINNGYAEVRARLRRVA